MQVSWRRRFYAPSSLAPERRRALEHLDRPDIDPAEKARSYRDLETVSRLPFQFAPLRRAVLRLAAKSGASRDPLRLVEIGAGTGWAGLRLAEALALRGHEVDLLSTDIRPEFLPAPGRRGDRITVRAARLDAVLDVIPAADITVTNLLIHHLDRADAARLLASMRGASRLGGAVFDLDRNRWAFQFFRAFFPLWARSPISCADSLISVQQAFRVDELVELAREAGIQSPRARRYVGLRTLLWWGV